MKLQTKLIILLAAVMIGSGEVWGNSASIDGTTFKSTTSWSGNHASFSLSGSNDGYNSTLKGLDIKKNTTYTINWSVNTGCTIKVTEVSVKAGSSKTSCKIQVSGGNQANIAWTTATSTASNLSLGNGKSITFSATNSACVYTISVTYTITPNKPGLSKTTETVNVTIDANNPTYLNIANDFTTSDHFGSYWTYGFNSNPNNKGVLSGSNFYATEAGTYKVYSCIQALNNCHVQSGNSDPLTITVNRLSPTLTYNNTNLDISVSDADKTTIDLNTLKTAYTGNGTISYAIKSGNGAHLIGSILYATSLGTIVVTATAAQTGQYNSLSKDFTITVQKRTPEITWKTFDHIYSGDILEDVASSSYTSQAVVLTKTYESHSDAVTVDVQDNSKLHVSNTLTAQQNAEVQVTTTETDYYKSVTATHSYTLEPKATPTFYLNGNELPTNTTTHLNLEIGQSANVSFALTDEANFEYPKTSTSNYFSYIHNASAHTGVITATRFGDETFSFHQKGTTTIFDHTCNIHIYVNKHVSQLTTPLTDGTWKVDSIYTGVVYSSNDSHEVIVTSSNEQVVKVTQEGIKAASEGEAVLYIRQAATNEWTGDTLEIHVNVEKYTPEITWNIDDNLPWGSVISNPVVSSNTELPYTVISGAPSRANYVDGQIEVYNNSGNVTFTFSQEGNYKWNAANIQKTIMVFQPQNHVPVTITSENYNSLKIGTSGIFEWNNGVRLGNASGGGLNYDDKYVIYSLTGIPNKLSFHTSVSASGATGIDWRVYESTTNGNWGEPIWSATNKNNDADFPLQPTTKYIKLVYSGNFAGTFSNIQISERKEVTAPNSLDFGQAFVGDGTTDKTATIHWYNVQTCSVSITGTDADMFELTEDSKTIASSIDNYGNASIHIAYKHETSGTHTATLTVESADGKSAAVTLHGKTDRVEPSIIWRDDITPMPQGEVYDGAAMATSGIRIFLTSSNPEIVQVQDSDKLLGVGVGTATITAHHTGNTKWADKEEQKVVEVTNKSVQHIVWNDKLSNLKLESGKTAVKTLSAVSDADAGLPIVYELDAAAQAFASVSGNTLTITGWGTGYITARQAGNDTYVAVNNVKKIVSRNPDAGCNPLVLDESGEVTLHTISSKEFSLNGEPAKLDFDAKMDGAAIGYGLKVAEYYEGGWHETGYISWGNMSSDYRHYSFSLNRKSTKIKIFTETGATLKRYFKNMEVTLAKYLELAQNNMNFIGVERGQVYDQQFTVNYSNITGSLDVKLENAGEQFEILTEDLGEDCGDYAKNAVVKVRCTGKTIGTENNAVIISNKDQSLRVPITAEIAKSTQQISWNPATTDLMTTDEVTLMATASSELPVSFVSSNEEIATLTQEGDIWTLHIHASGNVTIIASQAGNELYKPATNVEKVFTISRVTPTITTLPTASEIVLPKTLEQCTLTGGEASVAGTFAWEDKTTQIERYNTGYNVVFTPTDLNYYTSTTCKVVVPVAKDPQTITWDFSETEMFCNATFTFDATASSGLKVTYSTSNESIAYVDDANKLCIVKGGEVTITAHQAGNETWAVAPDVEKVLTIHRFSPEIVTIPTAGDILIGQLLSNSVLSGGKAALNGIAVDGTFVWENGNTTTIDVAGTATRKVIFTPQNSNYYDNASCEVEVEVKKYAPTITHTLSAAAITYGQALNTSVISGTLTAMDEVKYPNVEVSGSFGWLEPESFLNAGNQTATVRFTPENMDWYDVVDVEIDITVQKATLTTASAGSTILYGQILEEAVPQNTTADLVEGVVEGTFRWNVTEEQLQSYPTEGNHDYPILFTITDPNYVNTTISGTGSLKVEPGCAFKGDNGADWNDPHNWVGEKNPSGGEDKVLIMSNVVISNGTAMVGAMTIREGAQVTIKDGATLQIGDQESIQRKKYGNLNIENGGILTIDHNGSFAVNNFQMEVSGDKSGQIFHAENLHCNGDAYMDINLDASGTASYGWYAFAVPFEVDVTNGIFTTGGIKLTNERDYAIMQYQGDVRAKGKYGWIKTHKVTRTLKPGVFYLITVGDTDYATLRFKKTATGNLNNATDNLPLHEFPASEQGEAYKDNGWNGIANPGLHYVKATFGTEEEEKVQVYSHANNSFDAIPLSSANFVVGAPFFAKWVNNDGMLLSPANTILSAPEMQRTKEYNVRIGHNGTSYDDQLYLSANEDASVNYEEGHDLIKATMGNANVAQIHIDGYNHLALCDAEFRLENNQAVFPIVITTPSAGSYQLYVQQGPNDAHLYLMHGDLTLCDLTNEAYIVNLPKGTSSQYSLKLVTNKGITTENVPLYAPNNSCEKRIIRQHLYILNNGQLFDSTGKKVSSSSF